MILSDMKLLETPLSGAPAPARKVEQSLIDVNHQPRRQFEVARILEPIGVPL
jgi:hypothetical protein